MAFLGVFSHFLFSMKVVSGAKIQTVNLHCVTLWMLNYLNLQFYLFNDFTTQQQQNSLLWSQKSKPYSTGYLSRHCYYILCNELKKHSLWMMVISNAGDQQYSFSIILFHKVDSCASEHLQYAENSNTHQRITQNVHIFRCVNGPELSSNSKKKKMFYRYIQIDIYCIFLIK